MLQLDSQQKLDILLSEYRDKRQYQQNTLTIIFQIIGFAVAFFAGAVALFITNHDVPPTILWTIPLAFLAIFGIAIQRTFCLVISSLYLRDLESQIAERSQLNGFHYELIETGVLFSPRTGSRLFWALQSVLFLSAVLLYACIVWFCYSKLPAMSKIAGLIDPNILFLVIQSLFAVAVIITSITIFGNMHNYYNRWMSESNSGVKEHYFETIFFVILPMYISAPFQVFPNRQAS